MLFSQLEDKKVNPAAIVSRFENEEEHREVAALFNTKLEEIESKQEKEKALTDIVVKVKQNSIGSAETGNEAGIDLLARAVADKRAIEDLKRIHIFYK